MEFDNYGNKILQQHKCIAINIDRNNKEISLPKLITKEEGFLQ